MARPRFQPTPGDSLSSVEAGYRKQASTLDKGFVEKQLGFYSGTKLPQKVGAFKGMRDTQLYDMAAKAVLAKRKADKKAATPAPAPKALPKPAPKPVPKKTPTTTTTRRRRRRRATTTPSYGGSPSKLGTKVL